MDKLRKPDIQGNAWVAPGAVVIGNVTIGDESSVWYIAVVRGDTAPIVIGCGSNIQDGVVVHVDMGYPVKIGNSVTIGHNAIIHGCTIGHNSLIGMGAIIMDGVKIGEDCIVGAGSLITSNKEIPDGSLVMGSPAKVIRPLTDEEKKSIQTNGMEYMLLKDLMSGNNKEQ